MPRVKRSKVLIGIWLLPASALTLSVAAVNGPQAPVAVVDEGQAPAATVNPGQTPVVPGSTAAPVISSGVRERLESAQRLLAQKEWSAAIEAFRDADGLARGSCAECELGLARALNEVSSYREAAVQARHVLAATGDRMLLARAHAELGIALSFPSNASPAALGQAAQAFKQALELSDGALNTARFYLGVALIRAGKIEQGVAALREYAPKEPGDPSAAEAQGIVAEAQHAGRIAPTGPAAAAPPASRTDPGPVEARLESLEGEQLQLSSLRGKVVPLDFWASWCGPCVASLPSLERLAQKLAGKPFTLVSISGDTNGAKLREFLARHHPAWPQFWDGNGVAARQFGVAVLPTFVLLDEEGKRVSVVKGWGRTSESQLAAEVGRALSRRRGAK